MGLVNHRYDTLLHESMALWRTLLDTDDLLRRKAFAAIQRLVSYHALIQWRCGCFWVTSVARPVLARGHGGHGHLSGVSYRGV